jgi:hypothetical protein
MDVELSWGIEEAAKAQNAYYTQAVAPPYLGV